MKANPSLSHRERTKTLLHVRTPHKAFGAIQHLRYGFDFQHFGHQTTILIVG
jgi:hypothetical protein